MLFQLADLGFDFDFPNMGNRFLNGLLVTVFGVTVVFVMLLLLVLFIQAFHKVLESVKNRRDAAKANEPPITAAAVPQMLGVGEQWEPVGPDEAEIAAIVSAVALCSGLSEKQFVLRGIRRKKTPSKRFVS